MSLQQHQLKDDLLWLKWALIFLILAVVIAVSGYISAFSFRNEMQRREFNSLSSFDLVTGQVREIEIAENIIINNIDRFNNMVADSVMDEENRVDLLEEIRTIRERHQLFPIRVEIREQDRLLLVYAANVDSPTQQISLRSSQIQIQLPLLHEQDLARFLVDFMGSGRLMVSHRCVINGVALAETDALELGEHLRATCDFYWYTLRSEPFTGL